LIFAWKREFTTSPACRRRQVRVRSKFNLAVDNQKENDGYVKIGNHKVRVIKVMLDTGEIEVLLTNLTETFDFKELYFKRWGVEKEYDVLKNTLEIENLCDTFSS
jgi:hypothetical protein